eukprot:7860539-Pyramimonas_sp.AAC.1
MTRIAPRGPDICVLSSRANLEPHVQSRNVQPDAVLIPHPFAPSTVGPRLYRQGMSIFTASKAHPGISRSGGCGHVLAAPCGAGRPCRPTHEAAPRRLAHSQVGRTRGAA